MTKHDTEFLARLINQVNISPIDCAFLEDEICKYLESDDNEWFDSDKFINMCEGVK